MTFEVQLSPQALADVEAAYLWMRERSETGAARWYNRLMDSIDSLAELPERYGLAREAARVGTELRQMLVGKRAGTIRVLYTCAGRTVRVHRVRRAAQQDLRISDFEELA
jgi:plasmid stabilization system protein ParE